MLSYSVTYRKRLKELAKEQGESLERIEEIIEERRDEEDADTIEEKIEEQMSIVIESAMETDNEDEKDVQDKEE